MICITINLECTIALMESSMGSRTPPWLHHAGQTMVSRHGLGHLLGNSRTCGGRRLPPGASPSSRRLSDEWMDRSPSLGAQEVVFMPLGALRRAPPCLVRDLPWERRELGFHKISLVQIFLIRNPSLPTPYLPRLDSK
jgi:hypothetical protein